MKKIMIGLSAVLVSFAMVSSSIAATAATGKTLADNVALDKDLEVFQDYSQYPGTVGQVGKVVRFYDFDTQGGAAGTIKLIPAVPLKDNLLIRNGYIKVMEAVIPQAGGTNSLEVGDVEILATATNTMIAADLLLATIPVGTVATSIQTTNATSYVEFVNEGAAITNGKFMVVLDVELVP